MAFKGDADVRGGVVSGEVRLRRAGNEATVTGNRWKQVETGGNRWKQVETGGNRWKQVETNGAQCPLGEDLMGKNRI